MTKIERAVSEKDMQTISRIVHYMRFNMGLKYTDIRDFFLKNTGLTDSQQFDELMVDLEEVQV